MEFPRYLFVKNTLDPVLKNGNCKKKKNILKISQEEVSVCRMGGMEVCRRFCAGHYHTVVVSVSPKCCC